MNTVIVWFRNDLRIHDQPALAAAQDADSVIPVFVLDPRLTEGPRTSANRTRFLIECLCDLRTSLQAMGSNLIIRSGDPTEQLLALAQEHHVNAVHYTEDFSPFARRRDQEVTSALNEHGIITYDHYGRALVDNLTSLRAQTGGIYKVFTPFWKNWLQAPREPIARIDSLPPLPKGIKAGNIPSSFTDSEKDLSPYPLLGGEHHARSRLSKFLNERVTQYPELQNDLGADGTSRLSPYLHFGCLSAREIESLLPDSAGAEAFNRQLAWRDFYMYILYHFPETVTDAFQERYRNLRWNYDETLLAAWQNGQTGYPIVDAAMRQLKEEGWMHNRARLIVGSFLTKDLGFDWRLGERHFMRWLLDGDTAQNIGNWQWIASIGVDPAPLFRRLYNPSSQQTSYDPQGAYIKRYVPELADVPTTHLAAPWKMTPAEQKNAHCIIGKDYPLPIVDHTVARAATIARYATG